MSVQLRNQSGLLERVAGFNDTDAVLSPTSRNPVQNKTIYNALSLKIEKTVDDLVNYYTTAQCYNKQEVRELIGAINTLTIEVVAALPTTDISATTIYFVGPATGTNTYDEYVYVGSAWVKIGDTNIDLSSYVTSANLTTALQSYYTKTAVDALLSANYYDKDDVDDLLDAKEDVLTFDSTPTAGSSNPVTSAGVKTALDAKQNNLTFDTTPTANSSNPVTSGGIKTAIDTITNSTYKTTDLAEGTIADDDYFPMLDVSVDTPKKTLWSTIVAKLSNLFVYRKTSNAYNILKTARFYGTGGYFKITYPTTNGSTGLAYNMKTYDCTFVKGYSSNGYPCRIVFHNYTGNSSGTEVYQATLGIIIGYQKLTDLKIYWKAGEFYIGPTSGYATFVINSIVTNDSASNVNYDTNTTLTTIPTANLPSGLTDITSSFKWIVPTS